MYSELFRTLTTGDTRTVYRWAIDLLSGLASGASRFPAVRHPLGFVCYPVERDGPDGVCLHIWDPHGDTGAAPDLTTSEVHAHSWDLLSLVLYGTVRNTVFDAAPADPTEPHTPSDHSQPYGRTHRLCEVDSAGGTDRIRVTDQFVQLRTRCSELHRTGSVYALPAGVFHTSVVRDVAATVALGHEVPEAVDLSIAPVHTRTHDVHRTACSAAEAEDTARQAVALLRGGTHER